jgi:hypothetical protein
VRSSSNACGRCRAGAIRRVRQTLLSTNLAEGALVASKAPDRLDAAFDFMFERDPVLRPRRPPFDRPRDARRRLPLVDHPQSPQGFALKDAAHLARSVGAEAFRLMPARYLFALGVGHVRRRGLEPGARAKCPPPRSLWRR